MKTQVPLAMSTMVAMLLALPAMSMQGSVRPYVLLAHVESKRHTCAPSAPFSPLPRKDWRQEVFSESAQPLIQSQHNFILVSRAKHCCVLARNLLGRPAVTEIVECQRLARHTLRTLQRIRMAVMREIRRAE